MAHPRTGDNSLDELGTGLADPEGRLGMPQPVARDSSIWTIFYDGEEYHDTYINWVSDGVMRPGLTWEELSDGAAEWEEPLFNLINPPSGGGGGGRSRAVYVRPDDSLVRNAIEGAWDALTGNVDAAGVDAAIQTFYARDRANYDNEGQQIDAMEAVLEVIRATPEYKSIHQLRSESQDERTWISSKVGRLLSAGVSQPLAQELGTAQAQVGASSDTTLQAAENATLVGTGRTLASHRARMGDSMGAALGLL